MTGEEKLEGAISIIEGSIRIRFQDGTLQTLHSNNISLDEPETPLYSMVNKHIDRIYRPREEKEENLKYKEERKRAEKEAEKIEKGITKKEESKEEAKEGKTEEVVEEKKEGAPAKEKPEAKEKKKK